jgi:hypothetical protein
MLSLKADVHVPIVKNKQNKLGKRIIFCWHFESHCQKEQDPYSSGTDPYLPFPSHPSLRLGFSLKFSGKIWPKIGVLFPSAVDLDPMPNPDPGSSLSEMSVKKPTI